MDFSQQTFEPTYFELAITCRGDAALQPLPPTSTVHSNRAIHL
jgi:hypothetical protein